MVVVGELPERTLEQRMQALGKANEVRCRRARFKQLVRERRSGVLVVAVLLEVPEWAETMKVFDLLLAAPKLGRVKVNRMLTRCRISPSKTIGGLSERQRRELASALGVRLPADPPARLMWMALA